MNDPKFFEVDRPEPHLARGRAIITNHPEVRALAGHNPWTFVITVVIVVSQLVVAWVLRDASVWLIVALAWIWGSFPTHALFVVIHECTHRLVFRTAAANKMVAILCNVPSVFPSAISFINYHLKHHTGLGVYEIDADLPFKWELKVFGTTVIGRIAWLFLFPMLLALRPMRVKSVPVIDRWVLLNWVVILTVDVLVYWFMGPMALLYLFCSAYFAIGIHPLGARWIQEHYTETEKQETYDYYGGLNLLQLNIGYHNEHLDYHRSWLGVFLKFIFSGTLSVNSRVTHPTPNHPV